MTIDLDRLLKLRLVVARHGEMDCARWWNTNGLLGPKGKVLMGRGMPKTHLFAQARVVFSVARARSADVFRMPEAVTLWNLPAGLEDQFDSHWQEWLDHRDDWSLFFAEIEDLPSSDLLETLQLLDLVSEDEADQATRLRRSAEGRAVPLPDAEELDGRLLALLAAGFSRGEIGKPAIPYVKVG